MNKRLLLLFFTLLLNCQTRAQTSPGEGCSLNYRIIGFSVPVKQHISKYTIEIADGNYNDEKTFKINIIKTLSDKSNKLVVEVPLFGKQYTWRMKYDSAGITLNKSQLFHFNTLLNEEIDSCNTRFRIIQQAEKYKDGFVFLDSHRALYNMKGQPVWFLPEKYSENVFPRDLKLTPFGTITFLIGSDIYEINYNGDLLWTGPENGALTGDSGDYYHHEFTRLANGHYMVLGNEPVWLKSPGASDNSLTLIPYDQILAKNAGSTYRKVFFGTIIEYDKNGKIVWSWKSSTYFQNSDIIYHKSPDNEINLNTHQNAFYFDETHNEIYVSFKAIGRVLKISYPDGKTIQEYGVKFKPGVQWTDNGLFCGQHCCRCSQNGFLYLYNNNSCSPMRYPQLLIMEQPKTDTGHLKVIWEYNCTVDQTGPLRPRNFMFHTGGNIFELPDQSIFACLGGIYSKVFIVSLDKKILWSALPERWDEIGHCWNASSQYRASIITSANEFNKLIWNESMAK